MGKIKEISIGGSIKMSIDYQTFEAHVTITREVDENENPEDVKKDILADMDKWIRETLTRNYYIMKASLKTLKENKGK